MNRNHCRRRSERRAHAALVLPVRQSAEPRDFWHEIQAALADIGVDMELIAGGVDLAPGGSAPRPRRVVLASTFIPSLLRSRARVFLCVEYGAPSFVAALLARFLGKRAVILQEHAGREGFPLSRGRRIQRRLIAALATAIVANTDAAYAELRTVLRLPERKLRRATFLVPPARARLSKTRVATPEPRRRPLFLFVGQLIARKNVAALVRAAALLEERRLRFEVWIVGDGHLRADLEADAAMRGVGDCVLFFGAHPPTSLGAFYARANCFVMPSLWDYRSVAVLEAMRFGLPVIDSARDGNAQDFVRHGETGLVFDPRDTCGLMRAMEEVIVHPSEAVAMGQRAAALLAQHTPDTVATTLAEIVRENS